MIAITIVASIASAGLDFNRIFTTETLSDVLINAAITIFGTVSAIPAGGANTKQRYNGDTPGRFLTIYGEYLRVSIEVLKQHSRFSQWHKAQHSKEIHEKCLRYLIEKGVVQAEQVMLLSREQISSLRVAKKLEVNGQELYFKALSDEQIDACLRVADGKVSVHKLSDFYFLYYDGNGSKSFYDKAYEEQKATSAHFLLKLGYKLFLGIAITCIFTGLVVSVSTGDYPPGSPEAKQALYNALIKMFSRIFNAVTSTIWGWLIGQELVFDKCYYIEGKTQFLKLFLSDTDFVALTPEEEARLEVEGVDNENTDKEQAGVLE